jgi:hypothetical protein
LIQNPLPVWTGAAQSRVRAALAPPFVLGGLAEARWALTRILLVFLFARVLVIGCAVAVETLAPPSSQGAEGSILRASESPLLASLTSWDAVYYIGIARDGYQVGPVNGPYPEVVFFPLYPITVQLTAAATGVDLAVAGVLVANLAALVAFGLTYALARKRLAPAAALLATALVALQPGAVAFSMAYNDSLFLLLAVGSLLAAEWRARPAAGILAVLAALTRPQGALLVVPLLIVFALQDSRRPRLSWAWALGAPAGLALFGLAAGWVTGDILAPMRWQSVWDLGAVAGAVAEPWVLVVAGIVYAGTAAVAIWLLFDRWRGGKDPAGVAWGILNVGAILIARRLQSLPRYLAPVTGIAEQLTSGRYGLRVVEAVVAGAVFGYVVLALLHFSLRLAP